MPNVDECPPNTHFSLIGGGVVVIFDHESSNLFQRRQQK